MIRINLLPIRAAKKREYVKQQLLLFVVLIIGTLVGLYLWYDMVEGEITSKKKEIEQIKADIAQYNQAIGQVEKYKKMQEMLTRKLQIIDSLEKGKTGPVRVLDRLSQIIPKQVWLIEWLEKGSMVQVTGEALTMEDVGNFMRVLSTAEVSNVSAGKAGEEAAGAGGKKEKKPAGAKKYFTNIQLVSMEKAKEDKYNLNYVKFVLTMRVHYDI
ncbi:MAG: hypothetical protein DRI34_04240 [Deltaproteobacteria bacterium]|nr:MAG: hypothetical protein DRI34_04240 [Deltaproteobacteria bacterium]